MPIAEQLDAAGRPLTQAPEQEEETSRFPATPKSPSTLFREQVTGRPTRTREEETRVLQEQADRLSRFHLGQQGSGSTGGTLPGGWRVLESREIPLGASLVLNLRLEKRGPNTYDPPAYPTAKQIAGEVCTRLWDLPCWERLRDAREAVIDALHASLVLKTRMTALEAQVGVAMVSCTGQELAETLEALEVTGGDLEEQMAEAPLKIEQARAREAEAKAEVEAEARKLVAQWWSEKGPELPEPFWARFAKLLDEYLSSTRDFDPAPVLAEATKLLVK